MHPILDMNYPAVKESIFVTGSFYPDRIGAAYIINGTLLARTVVRMEAKRERERES